MAASFEDILITWKIENGDRFYGHKGEGSRLELMIDLIKTLEANGYDKDWLNPTKKGAIIDCCWHKNSKNPTEWRKLVAQDLEKALIIYYRPVEILKATQEELTLARNAPSLPRFEKATEEKKADIEVEIAEHDGVFQGSLDKSKLKETSPTPEVIPEEDFLSELLKDENGRE